MQSPLNPLRHGAHRTGAVVVLRNPKTQGASLVRKGTARDPAALPGSAALAAAAAVEGGCRCREAAGAAGAAGPPQLFPFAVIVLYKTLPQVMVGDVWCWWCAHWCGSVGRALLRGSKLCYSKLQILFYKSLLSEYYCENCGAVGWQRAQFVLPVLCPETV